MGFCFRRAYALAAAVFASCALRAFTVAENGVLKADIVMPAKPLDAERYAAIELKNHLDKAFGVPAVIIKENALRKSKYPFHFFVGATAAAKKAGIPGRELAPDEHVVKTRGNGFFLVGRDGPVKFRDIYRRISEPALCATIYAVYDFLENEMGVKWIWPGPTGEVVPKRKSFSTGEIDRVFREPLEDRIMGAMNWRGGSMGFSGKPAAIAFFDAQGRFLVRHRLGRRRKFESGHSFNGWWERYGKEHPEYFNMLPGGVRRPASSPKFVTMCVSEPGVWKRKVAEWREWWEKTGAPGGYEKWVNCCENDYMALCQCPKCRSWDAPDPRFALSPYWNGTMTLADIDGYRKRGNFWLLSLMTDHRWGIMKEDTSKRPVASVSDRYAKFYNAVQAEVRKTDPDASVIGYAYENYLEGPKETRLDPSIVVEFVPRSYFPYDKAESEYFRKTWSGWRKAGARRLVLRPNYMLAGGNYPFDQGRLFLDDFAYAYTNGMVSCSFDSLRGSWACHSMTTYSLVRAFRDPLRDPEKSREDVLSAFGPARREIKRYFDAIRRNNERWDADGVREIAWKNPTGNHNGGGSFNTCAAIIGDFFDDSFFAKGFAMLDAAEKAAGGDAEIAARVDYLRKGLRDAELTRKTRLAQKAAQAAPGDESKKAAFLAAFEEMKAYRLSVEGDFICNFLYEAVKEKQGLGWPY